MRRVEGTRGTSRLSSATYAVAAAATVLLLALSGRYGPHRDELYFVAAGRHPQWGYPDQPPLTPLVAGLADTLAPGSLLALRLLPALAVGAVVLVTADLARALGGGRAAELLAAVATATGAGVLVVGHMLSTATTDLLAWTVVVRLVVSTLQHDRPRQWLVVGLVLGVGLQNKHLVGFLAAGLVAGVVLTPGLRHHLRSPWAWGGAVVAILLWLPNLVWQAQHGWPQAELAADIREEYGTAGGIAELVLLQIVMINPLGAVLAAVGGVAGWRRPEWRWFRPVPIAYVVLLVVFVLTGGKNYYLLGLLPPLAAAGAVVLERHWSTRRVGAFTVAVAVTALFPLPALLPVLPASTLDASFYPALNEDQMETIGWPAVVGTVRRVVESLPAEERASAVVVTQNYGQAGALRWYGVAPPVYGTHNALADWGPPPEGSGPVVWVGFSAPDPAAITGCARAAQIDTGVDNEEDGNGVWVCDGPTRSWASAWKQLRHLDA
jgi:4-amino-4-deoxy-L-arabinose transferase-like glycosyltransferase